MKRSCRIGTLSALTGIPQSTLRFYETHGIVSPHKDCRTNYRTYTPEESCSFLLTKLYRSFELPLPQIPEFIQTASEEDIVDGLSAQEEDLDKRIRHLKLMKQKINTYHKACERARRLVGSAEEGERPPLSYVSGIFGDQVKASGGYAPVARQWIDLLPCTQYCFFIPRENLDGLENFSSQWGFSLEESDIQEFSIPRTGAEISLSGCRCLFMGMERTHAGVIEKTEIEPLLKIVTDRGCAVDGPIVGRFLMISHRGGEAVYSYLVSIPIKNN